MDRRAMRGALLTMLGGVLWGFSGTCGQFLLQKKGLTSDSAADLHAPGAGAGL